jgi:hypothetical protein
MKTFFILSLMSFSNLCFSEDCNRLVEALKDRNMLNAKIELNNNCNGIFEVKDDFGDAKGISLKSEISTLIRFYKACSENFKKHEIASLDFCLTNHDIENSATQLDKYLNTDFEKEIKKWTALVSESKRKRLDLIKKAKAEREALVTKEENDRKKQQEDDYKSGADLVRTGCSLQAIISRSKSVIENENEIGKISGVVNKSVLHRHGQFIVSSQNRLNEIGEEFKKRLGKPIDLSSCNR